MKVRKEIRNIKYKQYYYKGVSDGKEEGLFKMAIPLIIVSISLIFVIAAWIKSMHALVQ